MYRSARMATRFCCHRLTVVSVAGETPSSISTVASREASMDTPPSSATMISRGTKKTTVPSGQEFEVITW